MKLKYFEANNYSHIIILFFITTIGVYLRFHNLGALSIWNNEDYLAISVKSILENGTPLFPTDIIYPRALPFSYLTALFVKIFGYSEFSLRAPGAIFSSLSIIFTYIFARQVIGKNTALLAAALMSVFFWEIYTAQMARMYAMFDLMVLLSLVTIHAAEIDDKKNYKVLAFFSVILTAFLHQLAIALILMLLVYIPYFSYKKINPVKLLPYILVLIAAIIVNKLVASHYYEMWDKLVAQTSQITQDQNGNGFFSTVTSVATPLKTQLFSHLNNIEKILFYVSGALLFGALNYFIRNNIFRIALGTVILLVLFQQILAGFIVITALFISQLWIRGKHSHKEIGIVLAVQLAGLIAWLTFAIVSSDETSLAALKTAIKSLLPYPLIFFRLYLENFTWLSLACILTCIYILTNIYRFKRFDGAVFALLIFFVPLTALGFHPMALERMYERYIYFLNPFYIIIISYGIVELLRYLAEQWREKNYLLTYPLGLALITSILLSHEQIISRSFAFSSRHYGENTEIYNNWLRHYYFHPDHKGASLFISENYKPGDIIIVMNILAHYVYFQKVNYQLTLSSKKDAEGWIGAKSINTSKSLKSTLLKFSNHRIWFITSALQILKYQDTDEFKKIISSIKDASGKPRYVGRDGLTKVYCSGCN